MARRRVECTSSRSGALAPEIDERVDAARTHPQPVVGPRRDRHREHVPPGRGVVQVERELEVRPQLVIQVCEPRHVELSQLGGARLVDAAASHPALCHRVVHEHDLAVRARAGVGLEAPGAVFEGAAEGGQCVLG